MCIIYMSQLEATLTTCLVDMLEPSVISRLAIFGSASHYRTVKRSIAMEYARQRLSPFLRDLVFQQQNAATKMYRKDKNIFPDDANVQQGMANFNYAQTLYLSGNKAAKCFVKDWDELQVKLMLDEITPEDLYRMGSLHYILSSCIGHRGDQSACASSSSPSSSSANASSWDSTGKPLTTK